jgi:hypothetical protein
MMIRALIGHAQVHPLFECVFDSKNIAPPHWVVHRTN